MYKSNGNQGLFDQQFSQEHLKKMGDPLSSIRKAIDFEMFRKLLEASLRNKDKKSKVGAKPFDPVMMFKILMLQRYYGLGDHQTEYQIVDRSSFKDFLGLSSGDKVPDEKTIWAFREQVTKVGLVDKLFTQFNEYLDAEGMVFTEGKIIDASFVIAPRQRNTVEENKQIKDGKGDELWKNQPKKKQHKDIDARWTKKNEETFYGYKNHAKVDQKSKLIDTYTVTNAAVHDSQALAELWNKKDEKQALYADSAYTGENQEKTMQENGMENQVCKKGYRNKPLTEKEKEENKKKSRIRSRVEHVFGFMEQSMHGLRVRAVGLTRATAIIGLINLTYNLFRFEQIQRLAILSQG